jgi:hypothetical protein
MGDTFALPQNAVIEKIKKLRSGLPCGPLSKQLIKAPSHLMYNTVHLSEK